MIEVNNLLVYESSFNEWVLDSECTLHISPNSKLFTDCKFIKGGYVIMESNNRCSITTVGSIIIKQYNGKNITLSDVNLVPNLRRNL